MRDYGRVSPRFWVDEKVQTLEDSSKLLALYLLTSPHTNMIGAFRLPQQYVLADLGWNSIERVSKGFGNLSDRGFIELDKRFSWVFLPHYLRYNPLENPKQAIGAGKLFDQLPAQISFRPALAAALLAERFVSRDHRKSLENAVSELSRNPIETLSEPSRYQEQEQEQEYMGATVAAPGDLPFGSPEFRAAWEAFTKHRKEIRKPLRPTSGKTLLADLARHSEGEATAALLKSVANGWQGVFFEASGRSQASADVERLAKERERQEAYNRKCLEDLKRPQANPLDDPELNELRRQKRAAMAQKEKP